MTNDDLKRFYNVNDKPEQNKDFVRYGSNGEIITEHDATKDEEVVNYRTLMQHASGGGISSVKAENVDSESATSGQVLTANGNGGASWQNASGGEQVYEHHIAINDGGTELTFTIKNNDSTNYGQQELTKIMTALENQGFNSSTNRLMASGVLGYNPTEIQIITGVYSNNSFFMIVYKSIEATIDVANNKITFHTFGGGSSSLSRPDTVVDTVIEL